MGDHSPVCVADENPDRIVIPARAYMPASQPASHMMNIQDPSHMRMASCGLEVDAWDYSLLGQVADGVVEAHEALLRLGPLVDPQPRPHAARECRARQLNG